MASNAEKAAEIFKARVGTEDQPSDWHKVSQDQINQFADATGDHQFIHVDPEKASKTPFGTTIAHGFLTLSLLPFLQSSMRSDQQGGYEGLMMAVNYGLDKVRFPAPVKVDSRVRGRRVLSDVELKGGNAVQLKQTITVEIEGEGKPACVAESLTRLVFA
jgi:acyl dehydratase